MLGDWLSNPLKKRITQSLQNSLSRYISNVDLEGLGVGGDLVLRDLELRLDVLQESLNIPLSFVLTRGFIKELRITIPWAHLLSQPILVRVSTIECIVTARSELQYRRLQLKYEQRMRGARRSKSSARNRDSSEAEKHAPQAKQENSNSEPYSQSSYGSQLPQSSSELNEEEDDEEMFDDENGQQQSTGWIKAMITKVLANAHVEVNNLVLKYEHDNVVLSLALESLQLHSADPKDGWTPRYQEPSGPRQGLHKVCRVTDLTVCLDRTEYRNPADDVAHGSKSRIVQGFEVPILNKIQFTARTRINLDPFAVIPPTLTSVPYSTRCLVDPVRNLNPATDPFWNVSQIPSFRAIQHDLQLGDTEKPMADGAPGYCVVAILDLAVEDFHVAVSDRQFIMLGDLWVLPEGELSDQASESSEYRANDEVHSKNEKNKASVSKEQSTQAPVRKQSQNETKTKDNKSWTSRMWNAVVGDENEKDPVLMEILEETREKRNEERNAKPMFGVTVAALQVQSASLTLLMHRRPLLSYNRNETPRKQGQQPFNGDHNMESPVIQVPVANLGVVPIDLTPGTQELPSTRQSTKLVPIARLGAIGMQLEARTVESISGGGSSLEVYMDVERFDVVSEHQRGTHGSTPTNKAKLIQPVWSLSGVPTLPIILCGSQKAPSAADPSHPHDLWNFHKRKVSQPTKHASNHGKGDCTSWKLRETSQALRLMIRVPSSRKPDQATLNKHQQGEAARGYTTSRGTPLQVDVALSPCAVRVEASFINKFCDFLGMEANSAQSLRKPVLPDVKDGTAAAALQDLAAEYGHLVPKTRTSTPPIQFIATMPSFEVSASSAVVGDDSNKETACLSVHFHESVIFLEQDTPLLPSELDGGLLLSRQKHESSTNRTLPTRNFPEMQPGFSSPVQASQSPQSTIWGHFDFNQVSCELGIRGPLDYAALSRDANIPQRQSRLFHLEGSQIDFARQLPRLDLSNIHSQELLHQSASISAEASTHAKQVQVSASLLQMKGAIAILSTALGPLAKPLPEIAQMAAQDASNSHSNKAKSRRKVKNTTSSAVRHSVDENSQVLHVEMNEIAANCILHLFRNASTTTAATPVSSTVQAGVQVGSAALNLFGAQSSQHVFHTTNTESATTEGSNWQEYLDGKFVQVTVRAQELSGRSVNQLAKLCGYRKSFVSDISKVTEPTVAYRAPEMGIGVKIAPSTLNWDSLYELMEWKQVAEAQIEKLLTTRHHSSSLNHEHERTKSETNVLLMEENISTLKTSEAKLSIWEILLHDIKLATPKPARINVEVDIEPTLVCFTQAGIQLRLPIVSLSVSPCNVTNDFEAQWLRIRVEVVGMRLLLIRPRKAVKLGWSQRNESRTPANEFQHAALPDFGFIMDTLVSRTSETSGKLALKTQLEMNPLSISISRRLVRGLSLIRNLPRPSMPDQDIQFTYQPVKRNPITAVHSWECSASAPLVLVRLHTSDPHFNADALSNTVFQVPLLVEGDVHDFDINVEYAQESQRFSVSIGDISFREHCGQHTEPATTKKKRLGTGASSTKSKTGVSNVSFSNNYGNDSDDTNSESHMSECDNDWASLFHSLGTSPMLVILHSLTKRDICAFLSALGVSVPFEVVLLRGRESNSQVSDSMLLFSVISERVSLRLSKIVFQIPDRARLSSIDSTTSSIATRDENNSEGILPLFCTQSYVQRHSSALLIDAYEDKFITVSITKQVVDSNPKQVIDSNPKQVIDSNPKQVIDSNPKQVIDSNPKQVIDSNPKQVIDSNPKQVIDSNPKQVIDSNPKQVIDPNPKQVVDSNSKQVVDISAKVLGFDVTTRSPTLYAISCLLFPFQSFAKSNNNSTASLYERKGSLENVPKLKETKTESDFHKYTVRSIHVSVDKIRVFVPASAPLPFYSTVKDDCNSSLVPPCSSFLCLIDRVMLEYPASGANDPSNFPGGALNIGPTSLFTGCWIAAARGVIESRENAIFSAPTEVYMDVEVGNLVEFVPSELMPPVTISGALQNIEVDQVPKIVVPLSVSPLLIKFKSRTQFATTACALDALTSITSGFWRENNSSTATVKSTGGGAKRSRRMQHSIQMQLELNVPEVNILLLDAMESKNSTVTETICQFKIENIEMSSFTSSATALSKLTVGSVACVSRPDQMKQQMFGSARASIPTENRSTTPFLIASKRVSDSPTSGIAIHTSVEFNHELLMHLDGATLKSFFGYLSLSQLPQTVYRERVRCTSFYLKSRSSLSQNGSTVSRSVLSESFKRPSNVVANAWSLKVIVPAATIILATRLHGPAVVMSCEQIFAQQWSTSMSTNSSSTQAAYPAEAYPISVDVSCIGSEVSLPTWYRLLSAQQVCEQSGIKQFHVRGNVVQDPSRLVFLSRHDFRVTGMTSARPVRAKYTVEIPKLRASLSRNGLAIVSAVYSMLDELSVSQSTKKDENPQGKTSTSSQSVDGVVTIVEENEGVSDFSQLDRSFKRTGWPLPGQLCFTDLVHTKPYVKRFNTESAEQDGACDNEYSNPTSFGQYPFVPIASPVGATTGAHNDLSKVESLNGEGHWIAISWSYFEPRVVHKMTVQPLVLPSSIIKAALGEGTKVVNLQLCSWDTTQRRFNVVAGVSVPILRLKAGQRGSERQHGSDSDDSSTGLSGLASMFTEWMENNLDEDLLDRESKIHPRKRQRHKATSIDVTNPWSVCPSSTWVLRWYVPKEMVDPEMTTDTKELDHRFLAVSTVLASSSHVRSFSHSSFLPIAQWNISIPQLEVAIIHQCESELSAKITSQQRKELMTITVSDFEHSRSIVTVPSENQQQPGTRRYTNRTSGRAGLTVVNFKNLCSLEVMEPCQVDYISSIDGDGSIASSFEFTELNLILDQASILALHHGMQCFMQDMNEFPRLAVEIAQQTNNAQVVPLLKNDMNESNPGCQDCSCMRYIIVNHTGVDLWFGQHATSEALFVESGERTAYSWAIAGERCTTWPRLRFAMDVAATNTHSPDSWCEPLDIEAYGVHNRVVRYTSRSQHEKGGESTSLLRNDTLLEHGDSTLLWISVQHGNSGLQTVVDLFPSCTLFNYGSDSLQVRWCVTPVEDDSDFVATQSALRQDNAECHTIPGCVEVPKLMSNENSTNREAGNGANVKSGTTTNAHSSSASKVDGDSSNTHSSTPRTIRTGNTPLGYLADESVFHAFSGLNHVPIMTPLNMDEMSWKESHQLEHEVGATTQYRVYLLLRQGSAFPWSRAIQIFQTPNENQQASQLIEVPGLHGSNSSYYWFSKHQVPLYQPLQHRRNGGNSPRSVPSMSSTQSCRAGWGVLELHPTCRIRNELPHPVFCRICPEVAGLVTDDCFEESRKQLERTWEQRHRSLQQHDSPNFSPWPLTSPTPLSTLRDKAGPRSVPSQASSSSPFRRSAAQSRTGNTVSCGPSMSVGHQATVLRLNPGETKVLCVNPKLEQYLLIRMAPQAMEELSNNDRWSSPFLWLGPPHLLGTCEQPSVPSDRLNWVRMVGIGDRDCAVVTLVQNVPKALHCTVTLQPAVELINMTDQDLLMLSRLDPSSSLEVDTQRAVLLPQGRTTSSTASSVIQATCLNFASVKHAKSLEHDEIGEPIRWSENVMLNRKTSVFVVPITATVNRNSTREVADQTSDEGDNSTIRCWVKEIYCEVQVGKLSTRIVLRDRVVFHNKTGFDLQFRFPPFVVESNGGKKENMNIHLETKSSNHVHGDLQLNMWGKIPTITFMGSIEPSPSYVVETASSSRSVPSFYAEEDQNSVISGESSLSAWLRRGRTRSQARSVTGNSVGSGDVSESISLSTMDSTDGLRSARSEKTRTGKSQDLKAIKNFTRTGANHALLTLAQLRVVDVADEDADTEASNNIEWSDTIFVPQCMSTGKVMKRLVHVPRRNRSSSLGGKELMLCSAIETDGVVHVTVARESDPRIVLRNSTSLHLQISDASCSSVKDKRGHSSGFLPKGITELFPGEHFAHDFGLWQQEASQRSFKLKDILRSSPHWSLHQPSVNVTSEVGVPSVGDAFTEEGFQTHEPASGGLIEPTPASPSRIESGKLLFRLFQYGPNGEKLLSNDWSEPVWFLPNGKQEISLCLPPEKPRDIAVNAPQSSISSTAASLLSLVGERLKASVGSAVQGTGSVGVQDDATEVQDEYHESRMDGANKRRNDLETNTNAQDQTDGVLLRCADFVIEYETFGRCTVLHVRAKGLANAFYDDSCPMKVLSIPQPPSVRFRLSVNNFHVHAFDGNQELAHLSGSGFEYSQSTNSSRGISRGLSDGWSLWAHANGVMRHHQRFQRSQITLRHLQLDSSDPGCELPVVLYFSPDSEPLQVTFNTVLKSGIASLLYPSKYALLRKPAYYPLIHVRFPELTLGVEDVFFQKLAKFATPLAASIVAQQTNLNAHAGNNLKHDNEILAFSEHQVPQKCDILLWEGRVFIERLDVGQVELVASVQSNTSFAITLGTNRTPLSLSPILLSNVYGKTTVLTKDILASYAADALLESPVVLGSLEILGNPAGLVRSMGAGFRDLFLLPLESMRHGWGPGNVLRGVARGWTSLLLHVGDGTLSSLAGFSSSLSRNLDRLSMDEQYIRLRETRRRDRATPADSRSQAVSQGLVRGMVGFGESVVGAATGVVRMPFHGGAESGWGLSGVLRGVGKGLVGAVTKPVGGAAEFVAQASDGIRVGSGMALAVPHPKPKGSRVVWRTNRFLQIDWKLVRIGEQLKYVADSSCRVVRCMTHDGSISAVNTSSSRILLALTHSRVMLMPQQLENSWHVVDVLWQNIRSWSDSFDQPEKLSLTIEVSEATKDQLLRFLKRTANNYQDVPNQASLQSDRWQVDLELSLTLEDRRELSKVLVNLCGR